MSHESLVWLTYCTTMTFMAALDSSVAPSYQKKTIVNEASDQD